MGMDSGSLIDADPGFKDAAHGDWRLKPDARAHKIAFEPLGIPFC